jgi:hypothetical protein
MSPIYMIAGEKGDGKSLFSMAALDYWTNHGINCLLIDADPINPDVYNIYSKEVPSVILDLSTRDGWIELVNLCESNHDKTVIINQNANGIIGIEEHSKILLNSLFALERHLVTFWIMSEDTPNLNTLDRYKKVVGRRIVHIVNNQKHEDPENPESPSFLVNRRSDRYREFRRNGRIVFLSNLPEDTCEFFMGQQSTIKELIETVYDCSNIDITIDESEIFMMWEIYSWRNWIDEDIFSSVNWMIEDIINAGTETYYQTFTRKLADKIQIALQSIYTEDLDYSFSDLSTNDWGSEDIGDLLAVGKVSIEDLAGLSNEEDLDKKTSLQFISSLESETEEEYQEKLQKEYRKGDNPIDFIPSSSDIRERAYKEYMLGGNPKNFIPTEQEIRWRDVNYYHQGRPPAGFIPTQDEIDGHCDVPF